MKKTIQSRTISCFADQITPIGIYLNARGLYPGCILLESAEMEDKSNARSIICIQSLGGISLQEDQVSTWFGEEKDRLKLGPSVSLRDQLYRFIDQFEMTGSSGIVNGFFGYQAFESVRYFESEKAALCTGKHADIPLLEYRLYRYVVCFNHFNGEVTFVENSEPGAPSTLPELMDQLMRKQGSTFPFRLTSEETSPLSDHDFEEMVRRAQGHCRRGDIFQIVLSRRFERGYQGDEFNVYRALRHVNPSPYMFYFDYGAYKIFGSSPESQLHISQGRVSIQPIAGTCRRTGDPDTDKQLETSLLEDQKELAEHAMLVDLARNDLNRHCEEVEVAAYKTIQKYSHVMHIVSRVKGRLSEPARYIDVLADTFPAGTLSGAPKVRAIQLISEIEQDARGFYGGSIGFIDFKGQIHQAILIRSFMARHHRLHYRAGAGIVLKSDPASEVQEVHHKINALRRAMDEAEKL